MIPSLFSLVGWRGYQAAVENLLLIGFTRSERIRRKRFALLTIQQNVPRVIYMQINTTIIENGTVNIAVSQPIFASNTTVFLI